MSIDTTQIKDFLAQNDTAFDRLREVALREFEKGSEGLHLIVKELRAMQTAAEGTGLTILFDCLSDVSTLLQAWADDPTVAGQIAAVNDTWADVVYELSNYFVFMADDDQHDLRQRVNYRLVQLAKALSAQQPAAPVAIQSDGSWGLFEEGMTDPGAAKVPAAVAVASVPVRAQPAPLETESSQDSVLASHYLICLLGTQQYALPIHQVREILEQRLEKALPHQRPGIVGLVSVRGLVCPVVDVSRILHAKTEIGNGALRKKRCMVVCEVDRRTFCFNVDDVKQVASVDEFQDQIKPLNSDGHTQKAISHVAHFQDKSVLFVKMREVIPA